MINVTNVGHVVLKVRDLERSVRFYRDVLGLKDVARATFDRPMAFFSATGENHHDIGLFEIGPDAFGATTLPWWRRRCRSNSEDALKAGDPRVAMH